MNFVRQRMCAVQNVLLEQVRFATKSKGNRPCRQDRAQRPLFYGTKVFEGKRVKEGAQLMKQRGPRFHPGLNVVVKGEKLSLHAAVAGTVLVSREKINLNNQNEAVNAYYAKKDVNRIYKKFYHVIPDPQYSVFSLVAQV